MDTWLLLMNKLGGHLSKLEERREEERFLYKG